MEIEDKWEASADISLYKAQGQIGAKWYSLFNAQAASLIFLIILWVFLLSKLHPKTV